MKMVKKSFEDYSFNKVQLEGVFIILWTVRSDLESWNLASILFSRRKHSVRIFENSNSNELKSVEENIL